VKHPTLATAILSLSALLCSTACMPDPATVLDRRDATSEARVDAPVVDAAYDAPIDAAYDAPIDTEDAYDAPIDTEDAYDAPIDAVYDAPIEDVREVTDIVCAPGQTPCDGRCVDTRSSVLHCGRCGNACVARPNATASCTNGVCGFRCAETFGDCDGISTNGCETNLNTTASHCGRCQARCPRNTTCQSARCTSSRAEVWTTEREIMSMSVLGRSVYAGGNFIAVGVHTPFGVFFDTTTHEAVATPLRFADGPGVAIADGRGGYYIAGSFEVSGVEVPYRVVHVRADGSVDTVMNVDVTGFVLAMVLSDGVLYLGGEFTAVGGQPRTRLAAIHTTTGALADWAPDAEGGWVTSLAAAANTIYVGGRFTSIRGQMRNYLAAVDATTGALSAWNPNVNGQVLSLVVSGSVLYAGGSFSTVGGQRRINLAAIELATGSPSPWNPELSGDGLVFSLVVSGRTLFAGGGFQTIGTQTRNSLASFNLDTGALNSWAPNAIALRKIVVVGNTLYTGIAGTLFTLEGGLSRSRTEAFDITTGESVWEPGLNSDITTLATSGSTVFFGGRFTLRNVTPRPHLCAFDAETGVPTTWAPDVARRINDDLVTFVRAVGDTVYVKGTWAERTTGFAALDATSGAHTGSIRVDGSVSLAEVFGGRLYLSGAFTSVNSTPRNRFAAFDTSTYSLSTWNPAEMAPVRTLVGFGNAVYLGGTALDVTTAAPTSWNVMPNGRINLLGIAGNTLYAIGDFTIIAGQSRPGFAAFDLRTGSLLSTWNYTGGGTWSTSGPVAVAGTSYYYVTGNVIHEINLSTLMPTTWSARFDGTLNGLQASERFVHISGMFNSTSRTSPTYYATFAR
jgi:trimeric autotransporter adhesin